MTVHRDTSPAWIFAALAVLALVASADVLQATESASEIRAIVNKPFRITLDSNSTTGYSWKASYDKNFLRLKSSHYKKPAVRRPGAGGQQVFIFVPLKAGATKVQMEYKRPWESSVAQTRSFDVLIK